MTTIFTKVREYGPAHPTYQLLVTHYIFNTLFSLDSERRRKAAGLANLIRHYLGIINKAMLIHQGIRKIIALDNVCSAQPNLSLKKKRSVNSRSILIIIIYEEFNIYLAVDNQSIDAAELEFLTSYMEINNQ